MCSSGGWRLWAFVLSVPLVSQAAAAEPRREVISSTGLKLVEIPAGEFQMGCHAPARQLVKDFAEYERPADYFADEYPRHRVRITKPFLLGKHEVTVGQFRKFVAATGYKTGAETDGEGGWGYDAEKKRCLGRDPRFTWKDPGFKQSDHHPVLNVTWRDAQAFCRWLSGQDGRKYRLPTEAEWEYACRAGSDTHFHNGNDPAKLAEVSRTLDPTRHNLRLHVQELEIPNDGSVSFTSPVGSFPANAFGLHDMHGNVWEWTGDWYGEEYYANSPVEDPTGPDKSRVRVRRGGGWNSFPLWARTSFRNWNTEESRCVNLGFRVAADAEPVDEVSLLFVGDVMLDNGPGHLIASGKDPFAACAELLRDADLTICNLECVVGRGGKQILKSYTFRAARESVPVLKRHFDAVSLANNHSGDFGPKGLVEALSVLERERLPQFGGGRNEAESRRPLILERNGMRVALLGYNGFNAEAYAATEKRAGCAPLDEEKALADIRHAREKHQADVVIPFVHWGREMSPEPRASQRKLARKMIDAGASAVIGGHPHVTQTVDVYRGAPIVYSLGNFVFDYYPVDPPQWTGWTAKLRFVRGETTEFEIRAVTLDAAGAPHPVDPDE